MLQEAVMQCPRCQNVVLDELDRSGVTVDRCGNCRGIWLDRGELEKLIARATAELEGAAPVRAVPPSPQAAPQQPQYGHAPYGYEEREPPSSRRSYHGHKRHRSFWHQLFD
jgi:Zn-finger nucleic acid-binding protein